MFETGNKAGTRMHSELRDGLVPTSLREGWCIASSTPTEFPRPKTEASNTKSGTEARFHTPSTLYPIMHDIEKSVLYADTYLFEARIDGRRSFVRYYEQGHEVETQKCSYYEQGYEVGTNKRY